MNSRPPTFFAHLATSAMEKRVRSQLRGFQKERERGKILTIVTENRVEDGSEHEGLVEDGLDPLLVGLDTDDTVLGEGPGSIREETDGLEEVLDQDRLEDVELKKIERKGRRDATRRKRRRERVSFGSFHPRAHRFEGSRQKQFDTQTHLELSVRSSDGDGSVVSHHLASDHGQSLALSRVDLSGHDGGSRLVLGEGELSKAASRSGSEVSDVVGDLHERNGDGVESSGSLDDGVVGGESLELDESKKKRRVEGGLDG